MSFKYKILLVDDKESNLESLKVILDDNFENIQIYEALSAQIAMDIIAKNTIDLILSDVQMPAIDGYKFAKILSSNIRTKYIPIVFISAALTSENFVQEGLELGAIDYISKPIDIASFTNRIKIYFKLLEKQKHLENALEVEKELRKENAQITQELEFVSNSLEEEIKSNYSRNSTTPKPTVVTNPKLKQQKENLLKIKLKIVEQQKMMKEQHVGIARRKSSKVQ